MYTTKELKDMSVSELQKELSAAQKDLLHHRVMVRIGQKKTHHDIPISRRYIARVKTFLHNPSPTSTAPATPVNTPAV